MYDRPSVERAAGVSLQKETDPYIWLICHSFDNHSLKRMFFSAYGDLYVCDTKRNDTLGI